MANEFKTVSAKDPAIDWARMTKKQMHDFSVSREWKHLAFKPGTKPVVYHLREIPQRLFLSIVERVDDVSDKQIRSFQCSLRMVENMPVAADGVNLGASWTPAMVPSGDFITDESLERFKNYILLEIGDVAYRGSFFGQWTGITYALPPLLAAHLNGLAYLPAAVNQNSAETSSGVASAPAGEATQAA